MMMARKSKGLGERHKKIMAFLKSYQDAEGFPPTIREIGEATDISSTSVVNYYLDQLEKMGKIERQRKKSRGVRLAEVPNALSEMFSIPIAGRIVAGEPVPVPSSDFSYFDADTSIDVARTMLPPSGKNDDLFALEVDGDSMIDAMVNDGDIVIMKATQSAKNGEMVAVWLPERDETTLKYYFKEDNGYRLQPANPTMGPIMIAKDEPLEIKGKVIMVIRQIDNKPL